MPKKACQTILCLKWLQLLLLGGGTAENREHVVEGRGFFSTSFIYLECQKNTLSEHIVCQSHVIFNLLQEIKDDLEPSTSHTIPGLSKLLANLHCLSSGSFQHTVASLFFFATTLICATLGILHWSICKWDVTSAFFNLCMLVNHLQKFPQPLALSRNFFPV